MTDNKLGIQQGVYIYDVNDCLGQFPINSEFQMEKKKYRKALKIYFKLRFM